MTPMKLEAARASQLTCFKRQPLVMHGFYGKPPVGTLYSNRLVRVVRPHLVIMSSQTQGGAGQRHGLTRARRRAVRGGAGRGGAARGGRRERRGAGGAAQAARRRRRVAGGAARGGAERGGAGRGGAVAV